MRCANCLSTLPWHLTPRVSLQAGTAPSQQMGMSESSLETMYVHQVGIIRSGLPMGKLKRAFIMELKR